MGSPRRSERLQKWIPDLNRELLIIFGGYWCNGAEALRVLPPEQTRGETERLVVKGLGLARTHH
ncbi:hypothetical protein MUK42_33064 [Musa troglodytarum]|uniref:Uncharacterized protein n=1 Tax=Musa troglodytarum TaxID=320322 RepID=A0A9E7HI85_9LILI|nr:hypothetical protein MUK42_33064 [Musa troglodytarum]